jgi:hypothetical protein
MLRLGYKAKTYRCSGRLITGFAALVCFCPCSCSLFCPLVFCRLQIFNVCFRDEREIGKLIAIGEEGDGALSEVRNSRAVMITKRVQDKLTGRDFDNEAEPLDIDSQVRHPTCFSRCERIHSCATGRSSHFRGDIRGESKPGSLTLLS